MIDPVIFTIPGLNWPVRWYGVIVILGVFIGSWVVEREIKRRGENGDRIWDALLWILIPGILGARLWFVLNETLDGNRFYIENPVVPTIDDHIFRFSIRILFDINGQIL